MEVQMMSNEEMTQPVSQVNMFANLIRWVAVAKGTIGIEQMPVFLDIYSIGAYIPPGLKENILRLSDAIREQPANAEGADAWSWLVLQLHGIITGGGVPMHARQMLNSNAFEFKSGLRETWPNGDQAVDETVSPRLVIPNDDDVHEEGLIYPTSLQ